MSREFGEFRGMLRRARTLIGFFLLLMACAAAPGLADDPPTEPQEILTSTAEVDPAQLPGAADVTAGIERAEEEEAEREAWLASPEARQERQVSLTAHTGLPAAAAEALLADAFSEQLQSLDSDPARYLSDAQLLSPSEDPTAGTVKNDGNSVVLDAEIPLRTPSEDGRLQKVDLSLEQTAAGFETKNGLVDVSIPVAAGGAIKVGRDDVVEISQEGAAPERQARRFGDENVFYPDVLPDTDMLVSPIAGGVEIFNQLRSKDSPETFRFGIDLPAGGTLRTDEVWGVEVVAGGETIARIPRATAVDAQGTVVPVEMAVEGDSLVLRVDHRDGDYAMPILLDPILENNENWIYGQNHNALDLGVWGFNKNVSGMYGSTYCIHHCFGQPSNVRGLFVTGQAGTYLPNQFAQWSYSSPNAHSYIWSVSLWPYLRNDNPNCNPATTQHKQPHDYFGLWNPQGWAVITINSANHPAGSMTVQGAAQAAIFGLGSGGGSVFTIPCWRDLYAGGAHVWLDDWGLPWIEGGVTGISGIPSGWVSNETPFTITAVARDDGLGVKNVRIHHDGGPINYDVPPQNECAGTRRSPCHTTHLASFELDGGDFFPGERVTWLNASDATGKPTGDHHWTMRVDNEPPEVTLNGQFADATEDAGIERLRLPVYNLKIEAKDYELGAQGKDKRSGVKDIEVFLDGVEQEVPWVPQTCDSAGCPRTMVGTLPVVLSKLTTSGKHTLKVVAVDQVGKDMKVETEFEYFPATGMKDEYVMHYFPLPDGQGNEAEEEHPDRPELAVNVMNGNLVYRETDIDVESTAALDLEVERFYNSMLPENEETEWGEGWSLSQTPDLDPIKTGGSPVPDKAVVLDSSSVIEGDVSLPTAAGTSKFDPALQATVTRKESGGYELVDETGESPGAISFDSTGQAEALLDDGYAKVDYEYEGGELAEIEVSDPATFSADPAELAIPEPELVTEPAYEASFGVNGSGDGQLKSPADVAADSQGNLWVVDKANNRIQKFDPAGKFLAKFGSTGSGDGQFNRPTAIAIAANGNLLVTDAGNGRVQRFNSTGAFLSKFGSKGTGNGQFAGSGPESLTVDAAGNVWVSDTYGGRIQKFSSTGAFLQSVGTKGSAPGQLGEPTGIDVDPSGNVWVADWQNHRVSVFSAAGEYVNSFGSMGTGDGQFKNPDAIEVDSLGNVWVGDQSNHRIQQFDLAGQFKGKFGSAGSGPGQFSFSYPFGIAADSTGSLWVADVNNHRVQQWRVPVERPAFVRSWLMWGPADVAVGVEGNLWVVNRLANRIQKFDPSGKSLLNVGSSGAGDGQFSRPTAIAVDRDGNLLVTDSNSNRVQKFSPDGQFISKFGTGGAGDGQFSSPEGIATDFDGNIWVADSGNGRIQKFTEEGEFIEVVSSKGSEPGQLDKPVGIEVDPDGRVWVADLHSHRVSVFEEDGDFVGDFGTMGTGPGQFNGPSALEIDAHDNVWVLDSGNGRVQRFDLDGLYVGQFGSQGGGAGQFSVPTAATPAGIASDPSGRIWVTDAGNYRVQQWMLGHYHAEAPELDLSDGDPKVEVETEGDLVTNVSGNAAGTHTYEHQGDFLVSHEGPEGETLYERNAAGLLSKVTLPNGTWATITYHADNRVQSVTVAPNGSSPKATEFHYKDGPPRQSVVTPPDKPQITYDIGPDGSVLKWWHKEQNPEFLSITGSLWNEKEKEVPAGDLLLEVNGYSPHGLAAIEIIANGNQLVSEKRCEQDPSTPEIECKRIEDLWATDAASLAPGILNIEVTVTDRFGESVSERWWVQIPHTPPPVPGYPVPPKFSEIQKFREDYGLEVVFPVANERELVERIYNLINAWHSPGTPLGQVARASSARWGIPLRPEDVAELEYREWLYEVNAGRIDQWVEATKPSSYAGYYIDHRAGGVMHIGFTQDQANQLASLKGALALVAGERLQVYPVPPAASYLSVRAAGQSVWAAVESNATLADLVVNIEDDEAGKATRVGTPQVAQVQGILNQMLGANAPVTVEYEAGGGALLEGRYRNEGRMRAGDYINGDVHTLGGINAGPHPCTAGFGAKDEGQRADGGGSIERLFLLTAGHCFTKIDTEVWRAPQDQSQGFDDAGKSEVGRVARNALQYVERGGVRTDGAAIRIRKVGIVPLKIWGWDGNALRPEPAGRARLDNIVCYSGAVSKNVGCGPIVARSTRWTGTGTPYNLGGYWVDFPEDKRPVKGDKWVACMEPAYRGIYRFGVCRPPLGKLRRNARGASTASVQHGAMAGARYPSSPRYEAAAAKA